MGKILLPASHAFCGIAEKLNRSHENIDNLKAEIARFFQESKYPVLCDDNQKIIPEAIAYHSKRRIPLRFSVLAGEVIHHLRSCLDYIVWHFSETGYRQKNIRWIEFPILEGRPSPSNVFTKYERKVKGIADRRVLDLIDRAQPYQTNPANSLLLAIHKLDIADKHRALVIVASTGAFEFPVGLLERYIANQGEEPLAAPVNFVDDFKRQGKLIPQVAFSDFVWGEPEPVIQALGEMHNHVIGIVGQFDKFLA